MAPECSTELLERSTGAPECSTGTPELTTGQVFYSTGLPEYSTGFTERLKVTPLHATGTNKPKSGNFIVWVARLKMVATIIAPPVLHWRGFFNLTVVIFFNRCNPSKDWKPCCSVSIYASGKAAWSGSDQHCFQSTRVRRNSRCHEMPKPGP